MDITILLGGIFISYLLVSSIGIDSFALLFINFEALFLVIGCTFAATLIHFPVTQVLRIWNRLKVLFSFKKYNYINDIDYLITISKSIRTNGVQSIISTVNSCPDHFLKTGLQLLVDQLNIEELEKILTLNINYIERRHLQGII